MEKRIHILQVLSSLNMGGAESRMVDVLRNIDRKRFKIDFLCTSEGRQYYEQEVKDLGSRVIKIPIPSDPIRNFLDMLRVIRQYGPYDVIHAHTSYHCGLVMLAAKLAGVKTRISHARTTGSLRKDFIYSVNKWIGKLLVRLLATNRLAISEKAAEHLYGINWKTQKNTAVLPNTINTSLYLTCSESFDDIIREKNLPFQNGDCIIGHVGRFAKMKNQEFLVRLLPRLQEVDSRCRLVFIGDGAMRQDIIALAEKSGVGKSVVFAGIQNDIYRWMKVFSVVVLPSVYEGLCNVAVEAQASGVPCVLSSGIPKKETDLGLGIVQYLGIDDTQEHWVEAVFDAANSTRPTKEDIIKAIQTAGYDIHAICEKLSEIYQGN